MYVNLQAKNKQQGSYDPIFLCFVFEEQNKESKNYIHCVLSGLFSVLVFFFNLIIGLEVMSWQRREFDKF